MGNRHRRISIAFQNSVENTGLVLIGMMCGKDDMLCFMLDSGCDKTCINLTAFKDKMNLLETSNTTRDIYGMDGNVHVCNQRILHFGLGMNLTEEVSILPQENGLKTFSENVGFQVHGVFGVDFMRRTRCIIDFDKMRVLLDLDALDYLNKK